MREISKILFFVTALFLSVSTGAADPNPAGYENWKTDFSLHNIPMVEVQSGGPQKDGIPAIDDPKFISIAEALHEDNEPVIGFSFNGEAKAYPLSILMWHEIANDVVGGHPFAVTYCPLCNAAIVFDGMLEGEKLDFGTTGRLRNSDLLMYDRQSESWWQQFSGEAVIGSKTGKKLKIMPSRLESFARFKARFPEGKILVPNNPDMRQYGRNPYVDYDKRTQPYPFFTGDMPEGISPMAYVVVLRREGEARQAIALTKIVEAGEISKDGFTMTWTEGRASALGAAKISEGRDLGNLVVTEVVNGKTVDSVHDLTFAFVVHAFHPEIPIQK